MSPFLELNLHKELEFLELEFQKSDKSLNSSKTMVHCKIFWSIVVFGHFGLYVYKICFFFGVQILQPITGPADFSKTKNACRHRASRI